MLAADLHVVAGAREPCRSRVGLSGVPMHKDDSRHVVLGKQDNTPRATVAGPCACNTPRGVLRYPAA